LCQASFNDAFGASKAECLPTLLILAAGALGSAFLPFCHSLRPQDHAPVKFASSSLCDSRKQTASQRTPPPHPHSGLANHSVFPQKRYSLLQNALVLGSNLHPSRDGFSFRFRKARRTSRPRRHIGRDSLREIPLEMARWRLARRWCCPWSAAGMGCRISGSISGSISKHYTRHGQCARSCLESSIARRAMSLDRRSESCGILVENLLRLTTTRRNVRHGSAPARVCGRFMQKANGQV
jgi:hypothetical protein